MQEALNENIVRGFVSNLNSPVTHLLYADNILEGISILNTLAANLVYMEFCGVRYSPASEPTYDFRL